MGYSEPLREEAIKSCLAGYENIIKSGQPINRSGASSMWSRRAKKLVGAKNWFQDKVRHKDNARSEKMRLGTDQRGQNCLKGGIETKHITVSNLLDSNTT